MKLKIVSINFFINVHYLTPFQEKVRVVGTIVENKVWLLISSLNSYCYETDYKGDNISDFLVNLSHICEPFLSLVRSYSHVFVPRCCLLPLGSSNTTLLSCKGSSSSPQSYLPSSLLVPSHLARLSAESHPRRQYRPRHRQSSDLVHPFTYKLQYPLTLLKSLPIYLLNRLPNFRQLHATPKPKLVHGVRPSPLLRRTRVTSSREKVQLH